MAETKNEAKLNAMLLEYRNIYSFTSFIQHIPLNRHAPLCQQHEKSMACPNTQACSSTFKTEHQAEARRNTAFYKSQG